MFLVDTREHHLIPLLKDSEVVQLPVGDLWIGVGADKKPVKGGLVVERKTMTDFEASILDGRYREQRVRLLAFCQEQGASPLYILEGAFTASSGRLAASSLMKVATRLQYKHGIPILQTGSIAETAILVQTLAEVQAEDPLSFTRATEPLRAIDGIHVSKKVNANDPKQFLIACLSQCTGVSTKMAETIQSTYSSWAALLAASQSDLANLVQPNGRKVGPAVGARLWGLLPGDL